MRDLLATGGLRGVGQLAQLLFSLPKAGVGIERHSVEVPFQRQNIRGVLRFESVERRQDGFVVLSPPGLDSFGKAHDGFVHPAVGPQRFLSEFRLDSGPHSFGVKPGRTDPPDGDPGAENYNCSGCPLKKRGKRYGWFSLSRQFPGVKPLQAPLPGLNCLTALITFFEMRSQLLSVVGLHFTE